MRTKRLLCVLLAVLAATCALGQNPDGSFEDKFEYPPALYMGDCHLQPVLGGGPTGNYMPTTLIFAVINSQYSWVVSLYQDQYYQLDGAGKYVLQQRLPNPIGFNSLSAGSSTNSATRIDLLGFLGSWVWTAQHAAHPDYCTGVYRWQIKVVQSGVGTVFIREWTFTIGTNIQFNPNQFANGNDYSNGALNGSDGSGHPGGGGTTGGGGGVGANDPTVDGQNGFWSNLFVPDHAHLTSLKLTALQFSSWGPFGIFNAINGKFQQNFSPDSDAYHIHLYAPVPVINPDGTVGHAAGSGWITGDLTPYSNALSFARLVMSIGLWVTALFLVWKKFFQKVG